MNTEIRTSRLLLRRFKESDYNDLFEFLSQTEDDGCEGCPGIAYENGRLNEYTTVKYRICVIKTRNKAGWNGSSRF